MQRKNTKKDGDPFDFYETPAWATEALLKRESFEGEIWEPCCGRGAMSRVLEAAYGPDRVLSSDIRRDESVYGQCGIDFLTATRETYPSIDCIITNPPYNQAHEIVAHALKIANRKVAMFLKLVFLESEKRFEFFRSSPLRTVYVFSKRVQLYASDEAKATFEHNGSGGCIAFAWFVWERAYQGPPMLDWILEKAESETLPLFAGESA